MKKTMNAVIACALIASPVAACLYDATAYSRCETVYDTSFNGLYLIKERKCWGRLGFYSGSTEIGRRPLFQEF